MRVLLGSVLGLLLCSGLSADDKKDGRIDAGKLVGKWTTKEKDGMSLAVEFTKDGKATVTITDGKGAVTRREGTYKVDGNKVILTGKDGDVERTRTLTVSKLTDTEMVNTDERGREMTLVRVTAK